MSNNDRNLGVEQFKQGIYTFVFEWMRYLTDVTGVEAGISHTEPVAWLRELCDSLDEQQSKQHTKDNK